MHLHELMGWQGPMTERQYRAWLAWIREQYNVPRREDHYLMSVALRIQAIINGLSGTKRSISLDDMRITFAEKREGGGMSLEQATKASQARWFAATGYKPQ